MEHLRRGFPAMRVLWIPAPPASGAQSMDRYWRELDEVAGHEGREDFTFVSLIKGPPLQSRRAGRFARAWQRYVEYPARAWAVRRAKVVHLLDHSHAHVLPWLAGKGKRVVTVHDLIPLRDATGLTRTQVERFRRGTLKMKDADLILADSDFTAADVRALLGPSCPPVRTLLLGVDVAGFEKKATVIPWWLSDLPWETPVCFCVGSGLARKNLRILPGLLEEVLKEIPRLALLKIGPPLEPEIGAALSKLRPALKIIEIQQATEEELVAAYQRVDVLLFPSLLEGFGLPVLEAMAAGTPVVASNASSIPEVGLDACRYFDPQDAAAGAREVVAVLQDGALRAEMIQRGKARAAALDWRVHFGELCEIYRELAVERKKTPAAWSLPFRKWMNRLVVRLARAIGSTVKDVETGEVLGRGLILSWGGKVHLIGLAVPVRLVFVKQERMTYWRQQIGFTVYPKPDYPRVQQGEGTATPVPASEDQP